MKATPEECKSELEAKLLTDYKWMYDYNIELVTSLSKTKKQNHMLINEIGLLRIKNAELEQNIDSWISRCLFGIITITAIVGATLICLL